MIFKFLKKNTAEIADKISGRTDLLEAAVAASMLVAASGGISDGEIAKLAKVIKGSKVLAGFSPAQIDKTINLMAERAENGRVGKAELRKELTELKDPEDGEIVMDFALDVAESDGNIDDAEMVILRSVAEILGVNLDKKLAA